MYVEEDDLLLGELTDTLSSSVNPTQYLEMTAEEIDSKLGVMYVVPIDVATLPNSQGSLIKSIHRKLCSGRIIMAATIAHADGAIHQYALRLVKEAQMELMAVANSDVVLLGAERVDGEGVPRGDIPDAETADPEARVPTATNRDSNSAVVTFEENFMQTNIQTPLLTQWEPGR